ncbi:dephospho-CoA kinase [Lujinxingia litoralis]|uniref:Dephospho-CoA kinase n=1 Tax=Lujinxingia litoralis TaxID=2211119 RepID=A0A328CCP9_9DELT|nr:dephospho-CoA kinase [Lujinxingia litoralis]RAL25460.1 dephospho-CoA kinase [Lujinxingia litoralis]
MSTNSPGVVLGLTGGIASGKSTVSHYFRALGVTVIDADLIARKIVEPGQPALSEIVETFGEDVLHRDGTLNRTSLGERIFQDADARARLGTITHPRIAQEMARQSAAAFERGEPWVLYDAALIVENGLYRAFDALIVVACSPQTQLQRLMSRDDLSRTDAQRRIDAQMPLADKLKVADFVIDNDQSLDHTQAQVEELFSTINERVRTGGSARTPA